MQASARSRCEECFPVALVPELPRAPVGATPARLGSAQCGKALSRERPNFRPRCVACSLGNRRPRGGTLSCPVLCLEAPAFGLCLLCTPHRRKAVHVEKLQHI